MSPLDAFTVYNLAPLCARRDISNLGIIYRALTRRGPKKLWNLFHLDTQVRRTSPRWQIHRYQARDDYRCLHREYLNRSTFGYVSVFNLLPDAVFVFGDEKLPISVKCFQQNLTRLLRFVSGIEDCWYELFSPRAALSSHLLLHFRNLDELPVVE